MTNLNEIYSSLVKEFEELFVRHPAEIEGVKRIEWRQLREDRVDEALSFLSHSFLKLLEGVSEEIKDMLPVKPYPNANNGYQRELDDEEMIEDRTLWKVLDLLEKEKEKIHKYNDKGLK